MPAAHGSQKRVSDSLEQELEIIVSHHVDTANQTLVFCKSNTCSFVCVCGFLETGFLYSFGASPGTHSVDQAGIELREIHLPLPPECWD